MARRKSEANMFLSSQESANISGNEKKTPEPALSLPEKENRRAEKTDRLGKTPPEKTKPAKNVSGTKRDEAHASVSDILALLTSSKEIRERGVAKSIYLDKEVHDRIESLSIQSGVPFSKVINMLLRAALKESVG